MSRNESRRFCPHCLVGMSPREFADYCSVNECPETTKRAPTPQQMREAELAKREHATAQRGHNTRPRREGW